MKHSTLKRTALSILLCLFFKIGFAQVDQSLRIELPLEDIYGGYETITISDQNNLLLINQVKVREKKVYQWSFDLLNENLKNIKKNQMEFSMEFDITLSDLYENHYYIFKYDLKKGNYIILDLNVTDLSTKVQKGTMDKGLRFDEMLVMNGNLFLSVYYKKDHNIFVINSFTNNIKKIAPKALTELKAMYTDMQRIDNIEDAKEVVFKYKVCEKAGCDYMMLRFNSSGDQLGNFFFLPKADAERELTSISLSKLTTDQYLTTGTYSATKSNMANGIYLSRVNNGKTEFINYYNFLDLNNFTSFLSQRQQDKIEKKKNKKEEAGKEFNLNYRVAVHDISVKDGEYFFLGEFYYPTYRTETYTTMGANGTMVTHSRQVFDGYQYSHASVAGFDISGKLIWSNTFEMYLNYKPFRVKQFIRMNHEDDKTKMIYTTGTAIKTVTFKKNEVIKDEAVDIQMKTDESDVIKRSYNDNIEWWYGKNYISYGTQIIKNKENESGNKKREVFYMLKIAY
jgi:hypothetical protein